MKTTKQRKTTENNMKKSEVTGLMKRLLATSGWVNVTVLFSSVFNI